ncbi:MAG: HD domain-containing protein [Candidatus Thorarchaeota archaeon]|jgi:3'-5' exoribonuclease
MPRRRRIRSSTQPDAQIDKTMSVYRPIKSLEFGEEVTQVFLIAAIHGGITRQGKPYARVMLKDKGGQITVNLWDFNHREYPEFCSGAYAAMTIEIENYKGARQAKSRAMPMLVPPPDDLSDYESELGLTPRQAKEFFDKLIVYKDQIKNVFIKTYLDVIFDSVTTQHLFLTAPASVSNRGAYRGGLVEHTYKVMLNAVAIMDSQAEAKDPPPVDRDIVIAGVLVHDLGKMYAYEIDSIGARHTRSGLLLAHLPMSYGVSIQAFIQAESALHRTIPEEIKDHINHCILAHHGVLEYGSPVKPQSIEAQIIHVADMSDSTSSNFAEPTRGNLDHADENGFVEGSYFTSKTIYVGRKGEDEN